MRNCYTLCIAYIAIYFSILLVPQVTTAQCFINLNNQTTVYLDSNGSLTINPATIISSLSGDCSGALTVALFDNSGNFLGNDADCSMIGETTVVRLLHDDTGSFGFGGLEVLENIVPTINCTNAIINCSDSTLPEDVGGITALDNCDIDLTTNYTESIVPDVIDCIDPLYLRVITRVWTATDNSNNISASCQQTISILRADISMIEFPPNFDNVEENMLDCSADHPTTDVTGTPTLNGNTVNLSCKITTEFEDTILNTCEGTTKIIRTWTATDCCTGATLSDAQIIKLADSTPPTFTCPTSLNVGTDASSCEGTIVLPTIDATDNCSTFSTTIYSPFGSINTNGGTYSNIPEGTYDFNYYFMDDCGNENNCIIAVTVADDDSPTMICETYIDVSIGTSGYVIVDAADFDEASIDNCCNILTFQIKELDADDATYASSITFDCTDLGVQTVTLQATDCNSISNTCDILVEVEDKTEPTITCPDAVSLSCTDYPAGTDLTSLAIGDDNCGAPSISLNDVETLSECNTGTVVRTYTAIDAQGLTATCSQTLTYEDTTAPIITYPDDITINSCDIPLGTIDAGLATFVGDCEVFDYLPLGEDSDQIFATDTGCGIKILRTHQITEECSGTVYSQVQTIVIMDNEAPIFNQVAGALDVVANCSDTYVFPPNITLTASDFCSTAEITEISDISTEDACESAFTRIITYRATDLCGNSADFLATLTVVDNSLPVFDSCIDTIYVFSDILDACVVTTNITDIYTASDNCDNAVSITNSFNTNSAGDINGDYPIGTTEVVITATDDCGNEATCTVNVQINDVTGPDVFCPTDPVLVTLDSEGVAEVTIADFTNVIFNDDCSPLGTPGIYGDTLELTCQNALSFVPTPTPLEVTVYGVDTSLVDTTFCIISVYAIVPDTLPDLCDNERGALVFGTIFNEAEEKISGVEIMLSDNENMAIDTSQENGSFMFISEYPDGDCSLIPHYNDNITNGVTSYDLVLLKRHILGLEYLDSPYKVIAADVNNSGTVTSADLVAAKRAILGLDTEFINNTSWRFFPKNQYPISDNNPTTVDLPAEYLLVEPSWFAVGQDFIGVKIGDLNNSAE